MPTFTQDDVAPSAPVHFTFDDVASIEPMLAPTSRVFTMADVASVDPLPARTISPAAADRQPPRPPGALTPAELELVDRTAASRAARPAPPVPPRVPPPGAMPASPTGSVSATPPNPWEIPGLPDTNPDTLVGPRARAAARAPLIPESFVSDAVKTTQGWEREGELNRSPAMAAARGAVTGVVEGGRNVVRGFSSPLNLALAAAGLGEQAVVTRISKVAEDIPLIQEALGAARQVGGATAAANAGPLQAELKAATDRLLGLENLRATMQAGQAAAGVSFTVDGAKDLVLAPTWGERAAAAAQIAGGAAMTLSGAAGAANPSAITEALVERGRAAGATFAGSGSTEPPPDAAPPAGSAPVQPGEPPVPPRSDLVPPGEEARFNAAQTPAPETFTVDDVLSVEPPPGTPNELAQREAAAAPPASQDLAAIEAGRELERRVRAGEEKPDAVQEPGAVAGSVQRGTGAGDAAAGPPVGAGNTDAVQGPPGARVEEIAPPVTRPPGAAAQPPVIPSQTSAATMEAAHAGPVETPVAPAGPLARGGPEERAHADAGGPPAAPGGAAGGGARERPQSAAAAARAAETDTLDSLIQHAQAHGYAGDEGAARRHLEERLALIKDLDQEFADSGRNPETLLRDIARLGGLSVKAETGLKGELRWLKEFQDRVGGTVTRPRNAFGQVRGIQGVFNERGRSVDDMLTLLQQEPRYHHLDTLDTLLEEIRAAATAAHEPTAVQRLREGLGEEWWKQVVRSDRLDTGEAQDRLPGTEAARQAGKADTSFRAPVQATGDDFARSFLGEGEVPVEVEGDLFNDEPGSQGMPRREGPPVPERRVPSPGHFFGKQELPANRPTTLPARRFGRKVRVLPVAEMVHKLTDLFGGVPVSVGRLYKGYLGVYQPHKESIRVQVADDLHVIAHEMGHHLDMAIMEGSSVFNRGAIAKELKALGEPTSMPSYSAAQRRKEGTAEFFRRWLTDETDTPRVGSGVGQTLAQEAPKFTAAFEQYLDRHPKIGKGLRSIRNDVQRYLALPPEEQARLHIDFAGGGNSILRKAAALAKAAKTPEGRRSAMALMSSHWMDDLAALRVAEEALADGRPVDITESAYVQARLARGSAAKAEGFLTFGVRDVDGTFLGRSLDDALAPVLDRLEDFALYAAARRAKTMHARGKESGFTESQIAATIEKYQSPTFDQALQGLREFHRAKLDYMVRGGALSVEQRAKMLKLEPDYIPYQRIQDAVTTFLSGKKLANRGSPVKRLKGSGRRIANPLETIIRNTHTEVSTVEANKAMGKFVRLALKTQGHGQWLEEIPAPQVATRFKLNELSDQIRAALEEAGIELPQIPDMDDVLDEFATVFTPQQFAKGNDHVVTWLENGKRRWFEVHDPALYDALTAIGPRGAEQVVRWFQKGARVLQRTAVSTLGFTIRNPIKDQFAAVVQSRAGYRPGVDFLRGLFAYLGKTEQYQLYVNSLADQATMVSDNRDLLRKRLQELGHGKLRTFLDHTVLGPFDGLNALSHAGESATRIGEFMRTIDRADEGETPEAVLTQAALNARDVTQDFQRAGRQVRAWNQYTAFFSARVGGYGRMWEAFHEAPTNFMWKALTAIALPSILLWLLNHDDAEYNELPAWERNYYWHVPLTVAGKRLGFIRFPKPFELGQMFGTASELALEYLTKSDPQVANRLMSRQDAAQLVEQVFPTTILPFAEVFANYDFFRGRYIVNPWQEDLAPPLQYNRWTSETAKQLGELLDLSPAKIDTLIYGYTAGVGQGAMEAADLLEGSKKPAGGPGRWPVVGTLYRPMASSDAETFQEFFSARDLLAGLKASVKQYREVGREDRARALVDKNRALAPFERSVPAADTQLKTIRDQVNQVFATSALSPADKKQALDALYLQMLNIARGALGKAPLNRRPPPPLPPRPSAAAPAR